MLAAVDPRTGPRRSSTATLWPACSRASATSAPLTPAPTTTTSTTMLSASGAQGMRGRPRRNQTGVPVRRSRLAVTPPASFRSAGSSRTIGRGGSPAPCTDWSKSTSAPLIGMLSAESRNAVARATSMGSSRRPSGRPAPALSSQSGGELCATFWMVCSPGVFIQPMFSPLTRMPSRMRA